MRRSPPLLLRRRAYTLVEVLVVIAIIAILIALLLPGVQKVREASARINCRNNLRQIAIGVLNYESDRGTLPPGVAGMNYPDFSQPSDPNWYNSSGSYVGVFAFILPYVEQGAVFNQLQVDWNPYAEGPGWFLDSRNTPASRARIRLFECPSASNEAPPDGYIGPYLFELIFFSFGGPVTINDVFMLQNAYLSFDASDNLGITNYIGVAGTVGYTGVGELDAERGIFAHSLYSEAGTGTVKQVGMLRMKDVLDGASNTAMFGESMGKGNPAGVSQNQRAQRLWAWLSAGMNSSFPGLTDWEGRFPGDFSSAHAGTIHFSMGDGSVRGVKFPATPPPTGLKLLPNESAGPFRSYRAMSAIADGQEFDPNLLDP